MLYFLSALAFTLGYLGLSFLLGLGILSMLGLVHDRSEVLLLRLLAVPLGMGCVIAGLFGLAVADLLTTPYILSASVALLALALWWLRKHGTAGSLSLQSAAASCLVFFRSHPGSAIGLLIAAALGCFLAMSAPLEWDELSYHLPYARDYANAGGLVVSERLRYPLHSHNLQLLWATALLFSSEAAPHLVNAFCGALAAVGVFAYARGTFGRATGLLAAVIYAYFCRSLFDTAYVDIALSMFVFFAFIALAQWQSSREDGFLYISAFLLAMAAGIKYQGLLQLPAFGLAILVASRGALAPLAKASVVVLLLGTWWYLRNWLISGDPFHPFGGPHFGYWNWDEGDLAKQYAEIAHYRHHLPLVFIPALGMLAFPGKRTQQEIILLILGLTGVLAWYLTSRFDRYLLPSIPFLAILSARVLVTAAARIRATRVGASLRFPIGGAARMTIRFTGLALVILAAVLHVANQRSVICFTDERVEEVYAEKKWSFSVTRQVPGFRQLKLYQYGLENETYLLADDTAGDWYGPFRYRTVHELQEDPVALSEHLRQLGRDSLMVNRTRTYFAEFPGSASLSPEFETLYDDGAVSLYRLSKLR